MAAPLNRPAFDAYTKDEEIDKLYGPGAAAQYRKMLLEAQQAYANQAAAPVERTPAAPRQRGPKNEPRALPKNRAVGGVRRKDERREDFDARMNRGVPRGARSGAGGGLDEQLFIDEGMAPDEARLKAKILRSEGGEAYRDPKDGKIKTRGVGQRREVDLDGRAAYDPIRERQELMQRGREAVAARKEAQAADDFLVKKREDAIRKPGYVGGFANKYGTGEIKTTTPEEFAKRKPAMVTEGRNVPVTNKMTEVMGWMDDDQQDAGMPASGFEQRLRGVESQRKKLLSNSKGGKAIPLASQKYGAGSGQIDPGTGRQMIM